MEGWSVSDRMSGNCITREETMESAVRALILTTGLRLMAGNVRGMILRWISSWERSLLTMVWMEVEGPSPMWSMARAMNVVERRQSMAENLVQKSWVVEGSVVNWNCSTRSSAMRMQVAPVSGVQAKETRWAPGCIMRTSSRGVGVVEAPPAMGAAQTTWEKAAGSAIVVIIGVVPNGLGPCRVRHGTREGPQPMAVAEARAVT